MNNRFVKLLCSASSNSLLVTVTLAWIGVSVPFLHARGEDQPSIASNALCESYKADEAAADKLYKDKIITVTGLVYFAGATIFTKNNAFVSLKDNESNDCVACTFPGSALAEVKALKVDQQVTIRGYCEGTVIHSGRVRLKECQLVK